jgi:U4/U6 small nuclear ribonucleoprotein PRP3
MTLDSINESGSSNNTTNKNNHTNTNDGPAESGQNRRRRRRWGEVPPVPATSLTTTTNAPSPPELDPKAKVLAMQESIRARLAAAKAKQELQKTIAATPIATNEAASGASKRPLAYEPPNGLPKATKRAKTYNIDLSVTAPTFQKGTKAVGDATTTGTSPAPAVPLQKVNNPYLAHLEEHDTEAVVDDRLDRASKPRRPHKPLHFIEPGTFAALAERKREKAALAQASGYVSGRKTGHTIVSANLASVYGPQHGRDEEEDETLKPRWDAHPDTKMPLTMEWWDTELLPQKLKKQVAAAEAKELNSQAQAQLVNLDDTDTGTKAVTSVAADGNFEALQKACFDQAALSYSKTAALVQHIVPIKPPNAPSGPAKQAVLHLTRKELKRQRKLRRQEKQREMQDLQAAGLVPAPEPRLTLSNFIRVLGDQAFLDPSHMEQKVAQQMQARQQAHLKRNETNKLTKEQRAAKRTKKLQEDTSQGVTVALFLVQDLSHPLLRANLDLNAQQNNISGAVIECQDPSLGCVICEGGPKAIKRMTRLMLVRMKWRGPDDGEELEYESDEEDEAGEYSTHKYNPDNKCELVWQGMAVKRVFNGFLFQSVETSNQARKILKAKGVSHYWDQLLLCKSGRGEVFRLKLGDDSEDEEGNPFEKLDEDIVMADE